ncbi:MAG: iron ABC transporter permease [Clostridia bacterium]|nr:iron ABC transporter permease [Clostridia bacterium]
MLKKFILLLILLILSIALALCVGAVNIFACDKDTLYTILTTIRLPRVLGAALCGAALATGGTILQCVTQNHLSAPSVIGINSGAGFAVILTLCFIPSLWMLLPVAAFLGAILSCALIMGIAFGTGKKTGGSIIILCGVAVSSMLSAGISFLSLRYPDVLSSYTAFSVGGFSGTGWRELLIPCIIIHIALIVLQAISPKLNLLCLGDEMASTLGVNVRSIRITALICTSALCACAVSFAGLLGFVGLIVPHIVRRMAGNDIRYNIPLSYTAGAVLCVLSDLLGRTLFTPTELPCGIIMAFIGAPFFLYLLIARRYKGDRM